LHAEGEAEITHISGENASSGSLVIAWRGEAEITHISGAFAKTANAPEKTVS
jgi:hypothetical protein